MPPLTLGLSKNCRCFPLSLPSRALLGSIDDTVVVEGEADFACSEPAGQCKSGRRRDHDEQRNDRVAGAARAYVFLARSYFCSAQICRIPDTPF